MLDEQKLLNYLDEMIEKTEVAYGEEFKAENQYKVGMNDAFTAVRVLVKNAIERRNK